ncbi:C4-dicarboxylate ABC transporter substrate-binding protein [Corallococcus sp. H22C18031201]|nr:C4-dicarboxylate ABC transporter substrate-binding protein [Corallococcus sp. H22C18031201]
MKKDSLSGRFRRAALRELWLTFAPALLLVAAAFAVTFYFVQPAPPMKLVLAVAPDEGGFKYYARRYQEFLARHGVTLELRTTKGSAENLALLNSDTPSADVAFVQSGAPGIDQASHVLSLGSVAYVPLWVFYRGEPVEDLRGLQGRRIAVGPEESGTRALALTLLKANGADASPATELLPYERAEAIEQLKTGQVDAVFLVSPAESPPLQKLAAIPGVRLLDFARAEAYVRRYPYLSKLVLPRGVFDLARDVPAKDVTLVAPTANLVVTDRLHPALKYLLLRAASEVHGGSGLLDRAGEFPSPREAGLVLGSEARRYYESGVPLLQRHLPFWAANLVDRLWVMLVPFIAVVVPLGKAVPAFLLWRVRSRIFKWYARLKEIEIQLEENPGRPILEGMLARLDEAEREVNRIPMPIAYAENLYFFREHIDVVRRRITRRLTDAHSDSAPPAVSAMS